MFNFIIIGRNAIKTFNQIVKVFFLHKRSCQSPCKRSDYTNESTEWIVPKVSVDYAVKKYFWEIFVPSGPVNLAVNNKDMWFDEDKQSSSVV